MGWEVAYDLRAWEEFPGKGFGDMGGLIKQRLPGGVPGRPVRQAPRGGATPCDGRFRRPSPQGDAGRQGGFFAGPVTPE